MIHLLAAMCEAYPSPSHLLLGDASHFENELYPQLYVYTYIYIYIHTQYIYIYTYKVIYA